MDPERNFDLSNSALNEDQKAQLNTLLNEYSDLSANHSYDLGQTHLASHEISVANAAPVKQRPYRISHVNKPKVQQHLSGYVITLHNSSVSVPLVKPHMAGCGDTQILPPEIYL